ncbi:hypothetical protein Fmac_025912 [Flemingia macrophylla]|uniref:Uncharacterized protein n=1 Tax=Flemingia macrophylla TaxID=520843 RepID=A0ABD1LDM0_9FABA
MSLIMFLNTARKLEDFESSNLGEYELVPLYRVADKITQSLNHKHVGTVEASKFFNRVRYTLLEKS